MIIEASKANIVIAPSLIPYTFKTNATPNITPRANKGRAIRILGKFIQQFSHLF